MIALISLATGFGFDLVIASMRPPDDISLLPEFYILIIIIIINHYS